MEERSTILHVPKVLKNYLIKVWVKLLWKKNWEWEVFLPTNIDEAGLMLLNLPGF